MLGEKINIGNNVYVYPMPVTLVGAQVEGKANFMAVGWVSRVNANPPYIGISINKNHYTTKGILENGSFSVNFPSADMVKKTDYCGIVSGRKEDKSKLFEVFYGKIEYRTHDKGMHIKPRVQACRHNGISYKLFFCRGNP